MSDPLDDRAAGAAAEPRAPSGDPGLGEVLVVLLSATLAGVRDRLHEDGYDEAGDLVADLVEIADDHLARTCSPNAEKCQRSSLE
ncbi:MAG: hypothetical protein ACRDKZ_12185 [Actinomycetota bacterium]